MHHLLLLGVVPLEGLLAPRGRTGLPVHHPRLQVLAVHVAVEVLAVEPPVDDEGAVEQDGHEIGPQDAVQTVAHATVPALGLQHQVARRPGAREDLLLKLRVPLDPVLCETSSLCTGRT